MFKTIKQWLDPTQSKSLMMPFGKALISLLMLLIILKLDSMLIQDVFGMKNLSLNQEL